MKSLLKRSSVAGIVLFVILSMASCGQEEEKEIFQKVDDQAAAIFADHADKDKKQTPD